MNAESATAAAVIATPDNPVSVTYLANQARVLCSVCGPQTQILWHGNMVLVYSYYHVVLLAAQVGQVLLTLPSSFSATGLAVGITFQVVFATAALWTLYMLAALYQEFRKQRQAWRRDLHHGIIMVGFMCRFICHCMWHCRGMLSAAGTWAGHTANMLQHTLTKALSV